MQPFSITQRYQSAITAGALRPDPAQQAGIQALEALQQRITQTKPPAKRLFRLRKTAPVAAGLYLWGDVGRGKSMLMDMFVLSLPTRIRAKRIHFHAFMLNVHQQLFAFRQVHQGDVMERVIAEIAKDASVLCLDEMQVTDVTDAMILARLFTGLMDAGVTCVFTSNRRPRDLYQGGLQRDQFLKFAALLEARLPIIEINGSQDYRLAQMKSLSRTFMFPRDGAADDFLLKSWETLTDSAPSEALRIEVDGRILRIDKQVHGVAWLTFPELCMRPLGANDYLQLAKLFHTILLQGIPRLTPEERNEAKRFVTLIDALYDHRVKLIATAETPPDEIYPQGDGTFEFHRTVSRLHEMQSEEYLKLAHIA